VQIDKFQGLHFFKIEMNFGISLKQGKNGIYWIYHYVIAPFYGDVSITQGQAHQRCKRFAACRIIEYPLPQKGQNTTPCC
jgi:hypothetical protein